MPSFTSGKQQQQYEEPSTLPQPPRHPLLIPELRDQITEHFTIQDVIHCLLVNRLWNKVFTPYLYYTITLRQKALERAKADGVASAASLFPHYGHWVRHLDLRMNDPDMTLDIVRECCPGMESVKLNFGRLLEEQFEFFVLGVQSPALLTRFGGVRDPVQVTTSKRCMTTARPTTYAKTSNTVGTKLMTPQHQERRRRSVGTELSTTATAAALDDKQILSLTKAKRNSISAFPTLVPLTWAPAYEHPIVVPTAIIVPPVITITDTNTDARTDTVSTTALDASHWHIPSGRNGFLSNSIKNLQLQVPGGSFYAVLLWLTRAGLDGRLQGLRSFRLSGQETSAVFGVPSSAIHDFLAAHSGLEQLTLLSIQVEPAPSENPWDCLEGSEGSEMLQLMVDSGSSPTPTAVTAPTKSDSGVATRGAGTESDTNPEADEGAAATMKAIAAALAAAVAGKFAQPALYKGIHYKTHIPDYFADLIATSQSTLEELKSADPGATRSKVTELHIFQDGQLGPLLSRLPHLLRLTTEFFERSRISPDLLLPIQTSCRSLVSFTYLGKPSCPFADRYPRNNHPSPDPFFTHWESFMQELVHLKELILLNANLRDEDMRILVGYGHNRIRVLRIKGETRSTWRGARMVMENCSRLEECTLTCYGPVDDLFSNSGHPVVLLHPTTAAEASEEESEPGEHEGQQEPEPLQVIGRPEPPEWSSKDTLHSLCLIGMVLYNDEVNRQLFTRLKKLHHLHGLTIAGRGVTLEGLLGENLRVLALEDERLAQGELDACRQRHEAEYGSGSEELQAPVLCATCNAPVFSTSNHTCKKMRSSLYPDLETLDLPRLNQKLSSRDLIQLLKELPKLRWMDCGGAYELETLVWLDTRRRDLSKTFSR
ncbi:hypothetical protein BGX30_015150 [Mortierella sp. GBA39]|nr:hypothetical protein BGX30_015150 [Mortierella sp. GBA39]